MTDGSATLRPHALDQLRRSMAGEVIEPADRAYDEARRLWNAMHDRRPAVIARPRTAPDVAIAIRFAREHGLEITVKAGGHSKAGMTGVPGGLQVDLSAMRGVAVDPARRIARANGGALLGELDVAAQAHGLVCPVGVVGHTGAAGLTLGGGVGRLQRRFGLTIDNLEAVELVTADGRLVRASADVEPELFWGMRGAGWNFGIATAFEYRLHPFGPALHRGALFYRGAQVGDVWATFREYAATAPDAVSVIMGFGLAAPDAGYPDDVVGRPVVMLAYNHSGPAGAVEADTAGLRAGPSPLTSTMGSADYLEVQTAHDLVYGWGRRSLIAGLNADDVRPDALQEVVELVGTAPGEGSFSITALGGAIGRVPEDATAYTGRAARFDLSADATWDDAADDAANRTWIHQVMAAVEPDAALGRYANENAEVGPEVTRLLYGDAKLGRLASLKRTWDPDNVFHVNHNVRPDAA
ncbi:MAG TPA: FAD-binding oxidoreductase [Candidatus Limnocylindrales bacterium]|nr:FAD-binding oxidoreductase [Candidatus Limnocylindrales bacterium]